MQLLRLLGKPRSCLVPFIKQLLPLFNKRDILSPNEMFLEKFIVTKYFASAIKLYSTALFSYAIENKISSKLLEDFIKLKDVLAQNSSVISDISAPIYSKQEQDKLLSAIISKLGLSKEMINFIYVLAQNKKLTLLPLIAEHFYVLMSNHLGNKIVEVTLSNAVSLLEKNKIKTQLEKIFLTKLEISFKQDEKILAGIVIKTDNKMFDASLRTKFASLTDSVTKKIALL